MLNGADKRRVGNNDAVFVLKNNLAIINPDVRFTFQMAFIKTKREFDMPRGCEVSGAINT